MQHVLNKTFAPVGLLLKDGSVYPIPPRGRVDISNLDLDLDYFKQLLKQQIISLSPADERQADASTPVESSPEKTVPEESAPEESAPEESSQ